MGVGTSIFQQFYDSDGNPVGANVRVNSSLTIAHEKPHVEVLNDGSWIVSWHSYDEDAAETEVLARIYGPDGFATGPQFQVNSYTEGWQDRPEIVALQSGGFLVVWESDGPDGDGEGIRAQQYNSSGSPVGGEFGINTTTAGEQRWPKVATLENGNVIVTWQQPVYDATDNRIASTSYGLILSATGQPVGAEFEIFSGLDFNGAFDITALSDDRFVIVGWSYDGTTSTAIGQVFDATGTPLSPLSIQSVPGASLYEPRVNVLLDGGFVVTVTVDIPEDSGVGQENTFMQRFDADGELVGDPVQVNTTSGSGIYQDDADVTVLADGRIAVAWEGYNQNGESNNVFVRLYESQWVGTEGADDVAGTTGDDIIKGRGGNDDLQGLAGNDEIDGGNGHDTISGGGGRDILNGDRGNDIMDGGLGGDRMNGGLGNDVLIGGQGNDFLNGGVGLDEFHFNAGRDRIVRFDDDRDEIVLDGAALGVVGYSASDIIDEFGSISGNRAVFDFGDGNSLTVNGVTILDVFVDDIIIG